MNTCICVCVLFMYGCGWDDISLGDVEDYAVCVQIVLSLFLVVITPVDKLLY